MKMKNKTKTIITLILICLFTSISSVSVKGGIDVHINQVDYPQTIKEGEIFTITAHFEYLHGTCLYGRSDYQSPVELQYLINAIVFYIDPLPYAVLLGNYETYTPESITWTINSTKIGLIANDTLNFRFYFIAAVLINGEPVYGGTARTDIYSLTVEETPQKPTLTSFHLLYLVTPFLILSIVTNIKKKKEVKLYEK